MGLLGLTSAPHGARRCQPSVSGHHVHRSHGHRPTRLFICTSSRSISRRPGLRFKLSPHAGSREVVRQTTLEYLKAEHAQIAINVHYFWPWPSADADSSVLGIAASEGQVYSDCEAPVQSYALLPNAPGINIDAMNHATVVHCMPTPGDGRHVRESVVLWNTLAGSAQIVTEGIVTIPRYGDAEHPDAALTPGGPNNYSNERSRTTR